MSKKYHYTYRVNFVEIEGVYFGSRSCDCLPEEDVNYLGSPKTYKIYWKLYTPIKTILVTGFETRKDANLHEKELITQQWSRNKPLSLNASITNEKFNMLGVKRHHSPETRRKISIGNLGKFVSLETRKKQSEALKGEKHPYFGTKFSDEYRKKLSDAHKNGNQKYATKEFVGISPTGEHIIFENAYKFCRDNPEWGFQPQNINSCVQGNRPSHRGWRFFHYQTYLEVSDVSSLEYYEKAIKSYVGISPWGEHIRFSNAVNFSKENPDWGLTQTGISSCALGKLQTYNGWRFFFEKDYDKLNGVLEPVIYKRIRTFVGIAPDGQHHVFTNAAEFAKSNPHFGLKGNAINGCAWGEKGSHNGWKFLYLEDYIESKEPINPVKQRQYIGISPNGERYEFNNVNTFCRKNKQFSLLQSGVSGCITGRKDNYKGWKFYDAEKYEQLGLDVAS